MVTHRQLEDTNTRLPSIVLRNLQEDDNSFLDVERRAADVNTELPNDRLSSDIQQMCSRLASCLAQEVRCRLDRIFLETLSAPQRTDMFHSEANGELQSSLQVELDSIYTEIPSVIEMSIAHEYQTPLIDSLTSSVANNYESTNYTLAHVGITSR